MKKSLKLLAAALSCSALFPASAQSLGNFVDAAQPMVDIWPSGHHVLGTNWRYSPYSQRFAQTLTVEVGGIIAGVFLPIDCMTGAYATRTGAVYMEIRDVVAGLPGPTLLTRTLADAKYFDTDGRFVFVSLSGTLPVVRLQQIAIVLDNRSGACELRRSPPLGFPFTGYAGGEAFYEVSSNPGVWTPFSMTPYISDDIPFQLVLQ